MLASGHSQLLAHISL